MKSAIIDENLMIDLYLDKKMNPEQIGKQFRCSSTTIYNRLKKLGIKTRSFKEMSTCNRKISDKEIIRIYDNEKLSIAQTAKKIMISEGAVRNALARENHQARDLSESIRLIKGTADITNEELIQLYDKGWSCPKISKHFGVSREFVRQRFMVIDKERREYNGFNKGKDNPAWKGGVNSLRERIRHCEKGVNWTKACMERDGYKCQVTGQGGKLAVHHKHEFADILQEFLSLHPDLDPIKDIDKLFDLAQEYEPFWDLDNGMTLLEEVHKNLHKNRIDPAIAETIMHMHRDGYNRNQIAKGLGRSWHVVDRIFTLLEYK